MKLILKLGSLIFGFAIPIVILIHYFGGEKEIIRHSFGLVPTILIGVVGFVLIRMVFTIVHTKIVQDRTGTTAITFYLIVLLVLFGLAYSLLAFILNTAQANFEVFVATYTLYMNVVMGSVASIFIGLVLNGIEHMLKIKKTP